MKNSLTNVHHEIRSQIHRDVIDQLYSTVPSKVLRIACDPTVETPTLIKREIINYLLENELSGAKFIFLPNW